MRKRLTNSEIKARLVLMVGLALSLTFIHVRRDDLVLPDFRCTAS